ncbi:GGDEF domain-containing protein [Oceanobacillus neutriphilus]|uniref:GGDEF domain-containing protein n=1 Tax=Oceanobacillus neutriphilus TaxID=531815 RepID=A0ABQ2P3R5_9BACI|nr:GGDEF domain-containing protein [Oceanobacillus neutriphilus]GGP17108.1 hypothetical protein GCM10011346_51770 [Oceanobacillus neutriphilus]
MIQNKMTLNPEERKATNIDEIVKVYAKIDEGWLRFHYKLSIWLVIFAFMIECLLSIMIVQTDLLSTSVPVYIWRYIAVPSGMNLLCIGIATVVMRSHRISHQVKIYTISLLLVAMAFILFTVHTIFVSSYFIFAIAIMLTTAYTCYKVTTVTTAASLIGFAVSELFIVWDTEKSIIFNSALRLGDFLVGLVILLAFSFICLVFIHYQRKKNLASIQLELERFRLEKKLEIDEMTGVNNRTAFLRSLKNIEGSKHHKYILAIVDIDNFKKINDTWGHYSGDECIVQFSRVLKENSKKYTPYRYGGDEFCLIFQDIELEAAEEICRKIQEQLHKVEIKKLPDLNLTTSVGMAVYIDEMEVSEWFGNADQALYQAKEVRNAIRVY